MDQERYWMWTKRKTSLNSHVMSSNTPSYGDSWEEQAFAEDAAGPLGGCIWPPRSYTCSFCGREFRSAQALGGHMNVHRRDRARLNQSPSPNNKILDPTTTLSTLQYPTQVCNMICNPNSDSHHALLASTSLTPSRVSLLSSLSSPRIQGRQKGAPIISWSKSDREKYFNIADSTKEEMGSKVLESNSTAKGNHITADLSVNLNLVIRQRYATPNYDRDVALSCKRRRTDETLSFFPKRISVDGDQPQSEVLDELSPTSTIENLDLELRLGDRP